MKLETAKLPVVEVHWVDSATERGWHDQETFRQVAEPATCQSVGSLLKDTKKYVTVVQSHGEGLTCADSISIPRACITTFRRLK